VDALLRRLLRAAVRRGLAGDWTWIAIGISAFVLRRALREDKGIVETLTVSPGEQILITVRDSFAAVTSAGEAGGAEGSPDDS
jgi:hypothetical protein